MDASAAVLADVRAIFASRYDTDRLRAIPLVRDLLEAIGHEITRPDIAVVVRRSVDAAIGSLDNRSRTIVMRCDVAGETHRAVAADIGIGERYFYRERQRALLALATAMGAQRAVCATGIEREPQDALLGAATGLRNAGRLRDAAALLSVAYASERSPRVRVAIARQLAKFAADAADGANAARWVARGRRDLERGFDAPSESALAHCELDVIETRMLIVADDPRRAERSARALTRRLPGIAAHRDRDRVVAAAGAMYACLSEACAMRGAFADGLSSAIEGYSSLQRLGGSVPWVEVEALFSIAQARVLAGGSLARAAEDFQAAYTQAVSLSLGRDIAKISANLAFVYAVLGDRMRSAAFSKTSLILARQMLTTNERVLTSVDLVTAALARNDLPSARSITADTLPGEPSLMTDVLTVNDAEIALASGEAQRALSMVRRAAKQIERRGNLRFLGTAFRVEAEVLAAIGQRSAAATSIANALDCLQKAGHPISLSRAFALSSRVTGNRKHAAAARELYATLQAV